MSKETHKGWGCDTNMGTDGNRLLRNRLLYVDFRTFYEPVTPIGKNGKNPRSLVVHFRIWLPLLPVFWFSRGRL